MNTPVPSSLTPLGGSARGFYVDHILLHPNESTLMNTAVFRRSTVRLRHPVITCIRTSCKYVVNTFSASKKKSGPNFVVHFATFSLPFCFFPKTRAQNGLLQLASSSSYSPRASRSCCTSSSSAHFRLAILCPGFRKKAKGEGESGEMHNTVSSTESI